MSRPGRANNPAAGGSHAEWMRRALDLARDTNPHPNPRVGAVVVSADGVLVGEAAHRRPGEAHAEAAALLDAAERARGGTLFVTLEPCDHQGRTGPCTRAILEAGIARVVVGIGDPDGRVSGTGIRRLRKAGLSVIENVLATEAETLDPGYFHHRRTGRPLVTLKLAATLDGQTAAADGSSQWITSSEARAEAHALRAANDAVMVGAGTLRTDDPRLDVRIDGYDGPQPRPIVVAGLRPLPADAAVYQRNPIMYSPKELDRVPAGVDLEVLGHQSGVDLEGMMKDLGQRGIVTLLVEGGPSLARSLLDSELVDHMVLFLGGIVAGGVGRPMFEGIFETLSKARPLVIISATVVGGDVRIDAIPTSAMP